MNEPRSIPASVQPCTVHGYHWPEPMRTVYHHIWPLGDGGPDTKANQVATCDTGHYNIHACYDRLKAGKEVVVGVHGTRREVALARQGYDAWVRAGKP